MHARVRVSQVFCSACRRPTGFEEVEELVECSGCHRVFHRACYARGHAKVRALNPWLM